MIFIFMFMWKQTIKWQLQLKLFFKTVIKPFADENAIIFRSGLLNKKILF